MLARRVFLSGNPRERTCIEPIHLNKIPARLSHKFQENPVTILTKKK